jgi:hypothetical protein
MTLRLPFILRQHGSSKYIITLRPSNLCWIIVLSVGSLWLYFHQWRYLLLKNTSGLKGKPILPSFLAGHTLRIIVPGAYLEPAKLFLLEGNLRGKSLAFVLEKISHDFVKIFLLAFIIPFHFHKYHIFCALVLVTLMVEYVFVPRIKRYRELFEVKFNVHLVFGVAVVYAFLIFILFSMRFYILLQQNTSISFLATLKSTVFLYGVTFLPLGFLGIGIQSGLAVFLLQEYGVVAEQAISASLLLSFLNSIVPALFGILMLNKNQLNFVDVRRTVSAVYKLFTKGEV